ncbi:hypothetical protein MBAV_003907 [Candidatus Magnetobacterium bavaricum]|uniref:Uncharacterized protein n=1 Tax=Candidatus Magnetobacterium bavaricum TaxID=29290 RepID=A0A0F3GPP0_9BACT|nr:hypothetical protein MBAV_003907 [Candidatus Magnetobacterium bavaricum]
MVVILPSPSLYGRVVNLWSSLLVQNYQIHLLCSLHMFYTKRVFYYVTGVNL